MRIAVLCHGPIVMSAIEAIYNQNMLVGIAIPDQMQGVNAPIKMTASQTGAPFTVLYKKELSFQLVHWLDQLTPDVVCMMGFPYKIPEKVLRIPAYGFFNLHGGKLPEYAGADPIFWQIKNGEQKGVITIHRVEKKVDRGDIAHEEPVIYSCDDTYGMAMQRLGFALPRALISLIQQLSIKGEHLLLTPQRAVNNAPNHRPTDSDQMIDWSDPFYRINALIRACNPIYYGALTSFRGMPFRILSITLLPDKKDAEPGVIVSSDRQRGVHILCNKTQVASVDIVCMEGGIITGKQFAGMMNLKVGEKFLPISVQR